MFCNFIIPVCFLSLSMPCFSSKCLLPKDSVESLQDWYLETSDVVFSGKLISKDYKQDYQNILVFWEIDISVNPILVVKGFGETLEDVMSFQIKNSCQSCEPKLDPLMHKLREGEVYMFYTLMRDGDLILNECSEILTIKEIEGQSINKTPTPKKEQSKGQTR